MGKTNCLYFLKKEAVNATILMSAREDVQKAQITDSVLPPRIGLKFLRSFEVS